MADLPLEPTYEQKSLEYEINESSVNAIQLLIGINLQNKSTVIPCLLALLLAKWSFDDFVIDIEGDTCLDKNRMLNPEIFSQELDKQLVLSEWIELCHTNSSSLEQQKKYISEKTDSTLHTIEIIYTQNDKFVSKKTDAVLTFNISKTQMGYLIKSSWPTEKAYSHWEMFFKRFEFLMADILSKGNLPLIHYSLLHQTEKAQLEKSIRDIETPYPQYQDIIAVFEDMVAAYPAAIAIIDDKMMLTYHALNHRVHQLAHILQDKGVLAGNSVIILMDNRIDFIIALLATLKMECCYVPIDIDCPLERIQHIISDTKAQHVITHSDFLSCLGTDMCSEVILTNAIEALVDIPTNKTLPAPTNETACIMYTSGSTGAPKGVCIKQSSIINLVKNTNYIKIEPKDTLLHAGSHAFDSSLFHIFGALLNGAKLVLSHKEALISSDRLRELQKKNNITILFLTTAVLHEFACHSPDVFQHFSYILFGGERLQTAVLKNILKNGPPKHLIHMYGPTECTTFSTFYPVCAENIGREAIPIGHAIAGVFTVICDRFSQPLFQEARGEIYIGGKGLALGYLNNPELTQLSFITSYFMSTRPLYKTGDFAYLTSQNELVFLGRNDRQVKIRGYRIELEEIEKKLLEHPNIYQCCVLVSETKKFNQKKLVAFYSTPSQSRLLTENNIISYLKNFLPDYMVPSKFIWIEHWPLTKTGKINKESLLQQLNDKLSVFDTCIESDTVEATLVALCKNYLQVENIALTDNFLALGGDSIIAIQVAAAARQYHIMFQPHLLLSCQNLGELISDVITNKKLHHSTVCITANHFELSPIQKWFFSQSLGNPHYFNMSYFVHCQEDIALESFEKALCYVLEQHPIFNLRFVFKENHWQQYYDTRKKIQATKLLSILTCPDDKNAVEFMHELAKSAQASLNITQGPLLRILFFQQKNAFPILFFTIHHAVMDGVSWRILLEDLSKAYRAYAQGTLPSFPEPTAYFEQWVQAVTAYSDSHTATIHKAYWSSFAKQQVFSLIPQAPLVQQKALKFHQQTYDAHATKQLFTHTLKSSDVSINALLIGALLLAFQKTMGYSTLTLELEGHGREDFLELDTSRTIGWFTVLYPVTVSIDNPDVSMMQHLINVHDTLAKIPQRGFDYLLMQSEGKRPRGPCPQIKFNYLGRFQHSADTLFILQPTHSISQLDENNTWPYLLDIEMMVIEEQLVLTLRYSQEALDENQIKILSANFFDTLTTINDLTRTIPKSLPHSLSTRSFDPLPLQEGLLFQALNAPHSSAYVVQTELRVSKNIDILRLKNAFEQLMLTHESLRACFKENDDGRFSYDIYSSLSVPWKVIDGSSWHAESASIEYQALLEKDRQEGFHLFKPPLFRICIIQLKNNAHILMSHHHSILDGWSLSLLYQQWQELYFEQTNHFIQDKQTNHFEYLQWLSEQDAHTARKYWNAYLTDFTEVTRIPYHPCEQGISHGTSNTAYTVKKTLLISSALTKRFTTHYTATLNTAMVTGLGLLLQYLTGKEDVLFGSVISLRPIELSKIMSSLGLYINTLPIRFQAKPSDTLQDVFKELQQTFINHTVHGHLPLHQIKSDSSLASSDDLFDVLLVFENYPQITSHIGSSHSFIESIKITEETHYPLTLLIQQKNEEEYVLSALSHEKNYSKTFIQKFVAYYGTIIQALLSIEHTVISAVPILSFQEQQRLIYGYNQTQKDYPKKSRLETLIIEQAHKLPNAIAVMDATQSWTYAQLLEKSTQYRQHLPSFPASPLVAIAVNRRVELLGALLAILQTGAAFLPLDVSLPTARLEKILTLSKVTILITDEEHRHLFNSVDIDILTIEQLEQPPKTLIENQKLTSTAEDTAYVIYTSGSTGEPKGVMVSHRSLINCIIWMKYSLPINSDDKILQKTSISFDVGVCEIFSALVTGATLILSKNDQQADFYYLLQTINRYKISIIHFVPSFLKNFLLYMLHQKNVSLKLTSSLKKIICCGEAVTIDLIDDFYKYFNNSILYNFYGPTEATIGVTFIECAPNSTKVSIGTPISNTNIYIVNEKSQILPEEIAGEIIIAGDCLAQGYLNDRELTKEKFIKPFFNINKKIFLSGDIGYKDSAGKIYCLGRKDNQIKIRGYRIELDEIEFILKQHENIIQATVQLDKTKSEPLLIAFIQEKITSKKNTFNEYDVFLNHYLPKYMLPNTYQSINEFPVLPNGKIDRNKLQQYCIAKKTYETNNIREKDDLINKTLAIFEDILNVSNITLNDNFFSLGGHSLTAMRIVARINYFFSTSLSIRDIFNKPKLYAFIELLRGIINNDSPNSSDHLTSCIIPIKIYPQKNILFLVHPLAGTIYRFQALASYLSDTYSIYGIEDPGLHSDEYCFEKLEDMAKFYIKQLKKIQPNGPYFLGGASLGATIAIEMAIQLLNDNEIVAPVLLFDSWAYYPSVVSSDEYVDQYIIDQYKLLATLLDEKTFRTLPAPRLSVHRHRAKLLENYSWKRKKLPKLVLFKANELLSILKELKNDPYNYWNDFAPQKIITFSVPGDHDSMFLPPNVEYLAKSLNKYLTTFKISTLATKEFVS